MCRVCRGVYEVDGVRKWYKYAMHICLTRCDEVFRVHLSAATPGRQSLDIVLAMWEHVEVRGRGEGVWGVQSVVCEVWIGLVMCVKIVRWCEVGRK